MDLPDLPTHEDEFYAENASHGEHIKAMPNARQEHLGMMVEVVRDNGYETMYGFHDPDTGITIQRPVDEILHPKREVKKIVIKGVAYSALSGVAAAIVWQGVRFIKREKS